MFLQQNVAKAFFLDASVCSAVSNDGSNWRSDGGSTIVFLTASKASSWSAFQIKGLEGLSKGLSGVAAALMCGENSAICSTIPMKRRISVMFVGAGNLVIASSFAGSGDISPGPMT